MKTCVLLLGGLLATASLAQSTTTRREVWEWRDADGVVHYSDYPSPGARKIVIVGSIATASAPPPDAATPATKPSAAKADGAKATTTYQSLEIWSPESGASFFGADAVVDIRLRSEPQLAAGDRLLTYLDGKLLPGENRHEHNVAELERGAHSVSSIIIDAQGNEKIRSEPVVFHVREPSVIANPQNQGPAVRPPQPRTGG